MWMGVKRIEMSDIPYLCDYIGCHNIAYNHTMKQIDDLWLVEVHTCGEHINTIHLQHFELKQDTGAC